MRILIVDDEAPTRRLVELHLLAHPEVTAVVHAASAEEGVALAESQRFDIVIMDLILGVQDGRQLLLPLRLAAPDALIVALTALPAETAEATARRAGADLFMHKAAELYPQLADRLIAALDER